VAPSILAGASGQGQKVQTHVGRLNDFLEKNLTIARARGQKPPGPQPTNRMCERAHNAIARAVTNRPSHVQSLLQSLEDLRARSAPERLPHLLGSLGDACAQLQMVMNSDEFRARAGDDFPVLAALPGPTEPVGPNLLAVCDAAPYGYPESIEPSPGAARFGREATREEGAVRMLPPPPIVPAEPSTESNPFENCSDASNPFEKCSDASNPFEKCRDTDLSPFPRRGSNDSLASSNPFEDDAVVNAADLPRTPARSQPGHPEEHWADVYRLVLTLGGRGWRRHDRRSLLLRDGSLRICSKGSQVAVKSEVSVEMIRTCSLVDDRGSRVIRLVFWRPVAGDDMGVAAPKEYAFEFDTASAAAAFHEAIARMRS